jgi:hypothetical protein
VGKEDKKEDGGEAVDKQSKKDKGEFIKLRVIGQVRESVKIAC